MDVTSINCEVVEGSARARPSPANVYHRYFPLVCDELVEGVGNDPLLLPEITIEGIVATLVLNRGFFGTAE